MIIQPFNSSKMKQLQILFDKAVEATMNASGLSFEEFTTSRSERSVNARVVFVDYLISADLARYVALQHLTVDLTLKYLNLRQDLKPYYSTAQPHVGLAHQF